MEKYPTKKLIIDEGFKNLIRPLYKQEYLQLEANLLADGCRNPITTWNGVIVDGHNRYEICTRHGIPFEVEEMEFGCREEAIAWICANQLGRRNLTEETRKFLIGMQYESEKIINSRKNATGTNQYTVVHELDSLEETPVDDLDPNRFSRRKTAQKIADANHISHGTVEKYAIYTRALEEIGKKEPKLVPKILSGRYKVSHNGVLELAKLSKNEVISINRRLERTKQPFAQYQTTRKAIQKVTNSNHQPTVPNHQQEDIPMPSVKDMPEYDPDAEITGLTLTIPSWASSISRVKSGADLALVSGLARSRLQIALLDLQSTISDMLVAIKEE